MENSYVTMSDLHSWLLCLMCIIVLICFVLYFIITERLDNQSNYKELYEDLTKQYNDLEERNIFLEKANRRNSGHLIDMEEHIYDINNAFDDLYLNFSQYVNGKIDLSHLHYCIDVLCDVINKTDEE